ncbi:MAG: hypothetical protein U0930_25795 [Pirellulales bacterium]
MAIHEEKRENLMLEATAYSRRLLVRLNAVNFRDQPIRELFAGQRPGKMWSLYFDESPVLQFDSSGAIRRLFVQPQKFVVQHGKLIELLRQSQGGRVDHNSRELEPTEVYALLTELRELIQRTAEQFLRSRTLVNASQVLSVIPADDVALADELIQLLGRLSSKMELANTV